jgi:hypothetical protein
MGNDGGSFSHRTEMVKTKKKEEHKDNFEMAKAKSRLCALSKEPLHQPLAICRLGLLYNKEHIVKRLIEKNMPKAFRHIQKLKDVKEAKVQLTPNPSGKEEGIVIICPLSQIEFNGFHPFQMVWGCGCVFSQQAAKELKLTDKCLVCGEKIENPATSIISLNQTPD